MNVKKCWKSVKFPYVFLPKEEGCSSSSSTTSSVVNWSSHFGDAGCFPPRVPINVRFFLGFFGAGGWGMLLLLLAFIGKCYHYHDNLHIMTIFGNHHWA